MHGGLSPELSSIDLIRSIQRPCDVPDKGLLCDLLWSDPERELLSGWGINDRGVSYTFAEDVVHDFLQQHDLDLVCRAHQVMNSLQIGILLQSFRLPTTVVSSTMLVE